MSEKTIENNRICVTGKIASGSTFDREVFREGLHPVDVAVSRSSDQADIIPLMILERPININENYEGYTIKTQGQFHSYNRHEGAKNRLVLSIFVREIAFMEEFTGYIKTNQVLLDGYIYEVPIYRKTPLGRGIADLLVAVSRPCGKSDCISRVVWGRDARYTFGSEVGARVELWGRVQSRKYTKKISDNECEKRITYGVSVSKPENGEIEMREEI